MQTLNLNSKLKGRLACSLNELSDRPAIALLKALLKFTAHKGVALNPNKWIEITDELNRFEPFHAMNTTLKLDGEGYSPFVMLAGGRSNPLELLRESAANPVAISLSCPVETFRRCREKICVKRP